MSDRVHANPDDLRRLQKAVDAAQQEINEALKKLQQALNNADWHDSARDAFENQLKSASSSVKVTTTKLAELTPILSRHIRALQDFLQRH